MDIRGVKLNIDVQFRRAYNLANMSKDDFKARDVLELAGLTYRQLHDWEERAGVLESKRATSEGWRKFSVKEVIALAICAKLRESLALPLKETGSVYRWLIGKSPSSHERMRAARAERYLSSAREDTRMMALIDGYPESITEKKGRAREIEEGLLNEYINEGVELYVTEPVEYALTLAQRGIPIVLLSDLQTSYILSDKALVNWVAISLVKTPTIIFPLNDVLNEVLKKREGFQYKVREEYSVLYTLKKLRELTEISPNEKAVLHAIREREYNRVTAYIKGGQIVRIEKTEQESLTSKEQSKLEKQILEAIRKSDHQTVTVEKRDGEIVTIGRKASVKLGTVTGST